MLQFIPILCAVVLGPGSLPTSFNLKALPSVSSHKLSVKTSVVVRDPSGKVIEQGKVSFVIKQNIKPINEGQIEITTKLLSHGKSTGTPKMIAEFSKVLAALTSDKPRLENYGKENTMPEGLIDVGRTWKKTNGRGGASSVTTGVLQKIVMLYGVPTALVVETNSVSIQSKGQSVTSKRVSKKWISGLDHSIVKMQLIQDAKSEKGSQHSETSYEGG